jgi:hypothetical protein
MAATVHGEEYLLRHDSPRGTWAITEKGRQHPMQYEKTPLHQVDWGKVIINFIRVWTEESEVRVQVRKCFVTTQGG